MQRSNSNTLHFPIVIEQDEDNVYIVSCPVFKGCHSYGKTVDEALNNIREVIEMCIEEKNETSTETNRFIGFREIQINLNPQAI